MAQNAHIGVSFNTAPELPRCACCGELRGSVGYFDQDLEGLVCHDCWKQLRFAVAWMKHPSSPPGGGFPAMPINICGCYHDPQAPDNRKAA
jgi:hypothetical protein